MAGTTDSRGEARLALAADPSALGGGTAAGAVSGVSGSGSLAGPVLPGQVAGGTGRELSDEELVQRIREGEAAAGETLCRRYHAPLYRYLQRVSRSALIAEELYQQTWLSVLEHLDRFDPASSPGGFKAWLFRIATNKANDHWRLKGRQRTAQMKLAQEGEEEFPSASAGLEVTEKFSSLKRAIEALPEAQRQIVMLRYYSGMKFVEIAQMLGCPLNTALGRMHKAVLKLRASLEKEI